MLYSQVSFRIGIGCRIVFLYYIYIRIHRTPTISVGILCNNAELMRISLADGLGFVVSYQENEPSQAGPKLSTWSGCGADPGGMSARRSQAKPSRPGRAKRGKQSPDGCRTEKGARMIPKSQQRAVAKYNKEHYTQVIVKMNKERDSDILSILSSLPNGEKAGFIKRAIRHYVETLSI